MKPTNDKLFLSKERRACFFFAAANSDGDFQMLEWTTSGSIHPALCRFHLRLFLIHHRPGANSFSVSHVVRT